MTLRGITTLGILGSAVKRRAKNAKICLPLGITTKSDFVFTRPRPKADIEVLKARGPLVLSGCGGRSHSKHRQLLPYASKLR